MDALNTLHARHTLDLLSRSPLWAIRPDTLDNLLSLAVRPVLTADLERIAGIPFIAWEAAKPSTLGKGQSKVTVIPVQGILSNDSPSWFGSSYAGISDAVEQAAADSAVKRIVLAVDSPGGAVVGLPETAALIAQAAKVKPVSAIVEGTAASAAYWLTSQAHDVTLTPSGEVGSVGILMRHMDVSRALNEAGIAVTEMQAGLFKTEWSKFKPLSEDAKAAMQGRMDAAHQDFLSAITSGRGNRAPAATKEARFGEGRIFSATDALSAGLVDKIQASRDFYRAIVPTAEDIPAANPKFGLHHATAVVDVTKSRRKF